jgi:hypothetical protein
MPGAERPRGGSKNAGALSNEDRVVVALLVLTALVLAWPVISGGYYTYADNPSHLAEIHSLAGEQHQGWSDIAFCGFPIGTLHSPFWYGTLGMLVRFGIPAGLLYALMLFVGFIAPPLALYYVARRHLKPVTAGLLAYILLIQRPSLVGLGSPLAGMWTYHIAAALWILLIPRLLEPVRSRRDFVWIGLLVGLIASTHLFVVVPLAVVGVVHLVIALVKKSSVKTLGLQAGAAAAGIVAGATYWLPMFLARESVVFEPQNLAPAMVFGRWLLPTDIIGLVRGEAPELTVRLVIDAIPMVILAGAGTVGGFFLRKQRPTIALYGAAAGIAILILVAFVIPFSNARIFGPVSWRLVFFVRLGLALGAIPLFAVLERNNVIRTTGWPRWAAAAVCIGLAVWWGAPLRTAAPKKNSKEMTEVRELWNWLAENKTDEWGRVFLQDTFMTPPENKELWRSHVLSLTAHEAGVRQLGPYYGVVPYKSKTWTMGQIGLVYGMRVTRPEHLAEVKSRMRMTNATHLVAADPVLAARITSAGAFERLAEIGRFTVFEYRDGSHPRGPEGWVEPTDGNAAVRVTEYDTGRIAMIIEADASGASLLAKVAYHPFWKAEGIDGIELGAGRSGLMQVKRVPPGKHTLTLAYSPPLWPGLISILGWIVLVLAAVLPLKRLA